MDPGALIFSVNVPASFHVHIETAHVACVEKILPSDLWWIAGKLIDDVVVGTPADLVALLEERFGEGIPFELPVDERRVQLAVTLARRLQDRVIAAAAAEGWDAFSERVSVLRRLTDPQRVFTAPEPWGSPVPLILVRPTSRADYPTPDGLGRVSMVSCVTDWSFLGSLSLADPGWFRAGRFDRSVTMRRS